MLIQTIEFFEPEPLESGEIANDDRAEMVMPLLLAFRRAYYHHRMPGEDEPSEPLAVVLGDLLADLAHLADRLDSDTEPGENLGAEGIFARALDNWAEEVAIEQDDLECHGIDLTEGET